VLSGPLWRSLAVSGGLWRSLALAGGPTPRSAAVSYGLVSSIPHGFERGGPIRKDLTFPNRNVLEGGGPIRQDLTSPNRNVFEGGGPIGKDLTSV